MLGRIQDGNAMDEEMNSIQKSTTWELVSLPLGRKLVQCKWVFWNKLMMMVAPKNISQYW